MGLFDKLKKKISDVAATPAAAAPTFHAQEVEPSEDSSDDSSDSSDDSSFDLAGFDPSSDEEAFYNAVLHMESEGQFGGTDESRAEIQARFGIRDRRHWQTVKDSCYSVLAQQYGSNEVSQREMNWRQGQMQQHMQQQTAKAAASGDFLPVEGVSLDAWAAINASIIGGANHEDLLKGAGIDDARWQRASAEWNARMARDTTFAVASAYGAAFQNASKGKYGDYAREATAARAANRDVTMEPPMSHEDYWRVMYEQGYAAKQGKDPVAALKASGLTIVDWTDLGTFMGYVFHRDAGRNWAKYEAIHKKVEAEFAAKYPGVTTDLDIAF
jgi:hypothetical protein